MRCENCGQVLTPQSDPLCRSCLHEIRADPYQKQGDPQRSSLSTMDSERVRGGSNDEESAA